MRDKPVPLFINPTAGRGRAGRRLAVIKKLLHEAGCTGLFLGEFSKANEVFALQVFDQAMVWIKSTWRSFQALTAETMRFGKSLAAQCVAPLLGFGDNAFADLL